MSGEAFADWRLFAASKIAIFGFGALKALFWVLQPPIGLLPTNPELCQRTLELDEHLPAFYPKRLRKCIQRVQGHCDLSAFNFVNIIPHEASGAGSLLLGQTETRTERLEVLRDKFVKRALAIANREAT